MYSTTVLVLRSYFESGWPQREQKTNGNLVSQWKRTLSECQIRRWKRHILALTVINKDAIHTDLTALFEGLSLKPLLALCHFWCGISFVLQLITNETKCKKCFFISNFISFFLCFPIIRHRIWKKTNIKLVNFEKKLLIKYLTSGLNFINILSTAFTLVDPKSVKRHWWLNCIFYTFGIYECKSCT